MYESELKHILIIKAFLSYFFFDDKLSSLTNFIKWPNLSQFIQNFLEEKIELQNIAEIHQQN
jgi:hypothetical protein